MTQPRAALPNELNTSENIELLLPRAYLPVELYSPENIILLCKEILVQYIKQRKPSWESTTGWFASKLKQWGNAVTGGQTEMDKPKIFKDCDAFKSSIENISDHMDVIHLIEELDKAAVDTCYENPARRLFNLPKPTQRTYMYYAMIGLLQELLKLQFATEYVNYVNGLLDELEAEKFKAGSTATSRQSPASHNVRVDNSLKQLVLMGVSERYAEAFERGHNLFPHLTRIDIINYVPQDTIDNMEIEINKQRSKEAANATELTDSQLPNALWPYPLQPSFYLIYLLVHAKKFARTATLIAMVDPMIAKGSKRFSIQFNNQPNLFNQGVELQDDLGDLNIKGLMPPDTSKPIPEQSNPAIDPNANNIPETIVVPPALSATDAPSDVNNPGLLGEQVLSAATPTEPSAFIPILGQLDAQPPVIIPPPEPEKIFVPIVAIESPATEVPAPPLAPVPPVDTPPPVVAIAAAPEPATPPVVPSQKPSSTGLFAVPAAPAPATSDLVELPEQEEEVESFSEVLQVAGNGEAAAAPPPQTQSKRKKRPPARRGRK